MFSFFSFVYFVRNVLSRLLRHLLAPIGAVLNLPRGLSARSSLQIRTRYVPGHDNKKMNQSKTSFIHPMASPDGL